MVEPHQVQRLSGVEDAVVQQPLVDGAEPVAGPAWGQEFSAG